MLNIKPDTLSMFQVLIEKFKFTENFNLMDGRLLMCGVAVGVAMYALLWDYLYPFPQSKWVLSTDKICMFFLPI